MAKSGIAGAIGANLISTLLVLFLLSDFIPSSVLGKWFWIQLILFFTRIYSNIEISSKLKKDPLADVEFYAYVSLFSALFTAILFGVLNYIMFIYPVPDLYRFLIDTIMLILLASAVSTLSMVYLVFVGFTLLNGVPLVLFSFLQQEEVFHIFSYILMAYLPIQIVFGYIQYSFLKEVVQMQDTFQTLYEKSSDGIMLIKNGRFQDCNQAMVEMFGFNDKTTLLHTHLSVTLPKRQPDGSLSVKKMMRLLHQAERDGFASIEWLHNTLEGDPLWVEIILTKITLQGEEYIQGVWRDIQQRKQLEFEKEKAIQEIASLNQNLKNRVQKEIEKNRTKEKQLLQQSRMAQMGEMISMIAHQWRQPLAAISASSASIELQATLGVLDSEIAQKKSKEISNFAQHLSKTIDDFRNFFKPNKREIETSYDMLISSVLDIIGVSIRNKNISLKQDLHCHDTFHTYPNELKQVILNLLKNAEDALLEKGIENPWISIKTYTKEDYYILEISDNAGGIPANIIDKIFDIYFSTKTKKDGTGLGLYMSRTIIEEHCHGSLTVTNSEIGAMFTISLPRSENEKSL